jgi:O-antigen/teichoic acid export membrane protein
MLTRRALIGRLGLFLSGGLRDRFGTLARSRGLRERVLAPFSFDALILGTNLITGIIVARALGPAGRGEIAAILTLVFTSTWLFSLGSIETLAYHQSRRPKEASELLTLWLGVAAATSLAAIVAAELVLPLLFNAQTDAAIDLARLYIPIVAFSLFTVMFNGILLGDQDFFAYNLIRTLYPAAVAVGYVGCLLTGTLSVETALVANAVGTALSCGAAIFHCGRRHGLSRPQPGLLRETLWYGVRAHGGSVAGFVNARLDLLILPAFLAATSVGLYSVATNVTSLIGALTGTIAIFALPVAARLRATSTRTVIRTLHATVAIGLTLGLVIALLAGVAVELLYGSNFESAVTPLRIMLPGEILDACSVVLWAGLLAANRPFLSSAAAGPGAVLTITGLVLFLESGGIVAAAIVTSSAHTLVFTISILLYRHAKGLRWRDFLKPPDAAAAPAPAA